MSRLLQILRKIPRTKPRFAVSDALQKNVLKIAFITKLKLPNNNQEVLRIPSSKLPRYFPFHQFRHLAFALSILTWLGFTKEDEEKDSELIMTLKRAVLCTQREEFDKAEQMLHLALR